MEEKTATDGAAERTIVLRIDGMTCTNCQNKIERELKNTAGIKNAEVWYAKGTAAVTYNPERIALKEIYAAVEKAGYKVLEENRRKPLFRIAGTVIVIFALFIMARQIGTSGLANAFPLAEAGMGYGMIFLIGLITSVHCAAMCGGISLSQCIPPGTRRLSGKADSPGGTEPGREIRGAALLPSLLYNGGRIISYTLIGAAVGALGSAITLTGAMRGAVQLIAGVFMVIMGINMLGFFPGLRRVTPRLPRIFTRKIEAEKAVNKNPLIIGFLNGFMPCGPLQAMQLYALSTGSPAAGAFSMFLFSLGTAPLMFFLGALSSLLSRRFTALVMQAGAVLVAALGLAMFSNGLSLSGFSLDSLNPARAFVKPAAYGQGGQAAAPFRPVIENGVQIVNSTLSGGRYPAITVQAGIPVKWIINAPQGSVNGCNFQMYIREYGIEYQFKSGENTIEFTPVRTGNFSYSCWMGMIRSSITVVAGDGEIAGSGGTVPSEPGFSPVPAGVQIPTDALAVAVLDRDKGVQEVRINLRDGGFEPAVIVVQRDIPAEWTINNNSLDEGNNFLIFPRYYTHMPMDQGDNVIGFLPGGDFEFSTADSVYYGYVKVVDDISNINAEAIKREVAGFETLIYPDAYFDAVSRGGSAGGCCAGRGQG